MTPQHTSPSGADAPALHAVPRPEPREIREVGPTTGAISLPVGQGMVFVSADGSWGGRVAS